MIRLILVATSRVYSNSEILENKLAEVKDKVTSSLKDTLTYVTTTKVKISLFNVQHPAQGKSEIKVNDIAIACAICYHIVGASLSEPRIIICMFMKLSVCCFVCTFIAQCCIAEYFTAGQFGKFGKSSMIRQTKTIKFLFIIISYNQINSLAKLFC